MINQVQANFPVFMTGVGFGIAGVYAIKIAGPAVWQMIKKVGYNVWDDAKGLASKAKFW